MIDKAYMMLHDTYSLMTINDSDWWMVILSKNMVRDTVNDMMLTVSRMGTVMVDNGWCQQWLMRLDVRHTIRECETVNSSCLIWDVMVANDGKWWLTISWWCIYSSNHQRHHTTLTQDTADLWGRTLGLRPRPQKRPTSIASKLRSQVRKLIQLLGGFAVWNMSYCWTISASNSCNVVCLSTMLISHFLIWG